MDTAGARVLIVDDDASSRRLLEVRMRALGCDVALAANGREAQEAIRQDVPALMLLDLEMPRMGGMELLRALRQEGLDVPSIVITAHGSIETAVEAMREGAYDFLPKPFDPKHLELVVRKALERRELLESNQLLRETLAARFPEILGTSQPIQRPIDVARNVAPTNSTVLLLGESGTGKEVFAQAIHRWSSRADRPFVIVNCVALSEALLESELFGHEKGAFTGAHQTKRGKFELAHGGTVFLDEIGDMPPSLQAKLLRVLQDHTFERVGGTRPIRADIRVISATNRDLEKAVQDGRFREDLFYRLNVITVQLPPLRERREDIPLLAQHFLRRYAGKNAKAITGFTEEALDLLQTYAWPGNVRELENVIERAVVLTRSSIISPADLPETVVGSDQAARHLVVSIGTPLEEVEDRLIEETLHYTKGDKTLAAKLLGIATRTIYRRMKGESEPAGSSASESTTSPAESPQQDD
jgi:two-component system response regulator HydG